MFWTSDYCFSNKDALTVLLYCIHFLQLILNQSTMAPLLRELRRLIRLRLGEIRDIVGYNIAACRFVGQVAKEHKESKMLSTSQMATTDIWAGLGLGSDIAAALEGQAKPGKKKS